MGALRRNRDLEADPAQDRVSPRTRARIRAAPLLARMTAKPGSAARRALVRRARLLLRWTDTPRGTLMKTEVVRYEADGLAMIGHLAWDETASTPRPGVLVFPEAFGLGPHAKSRAERLAAELGYVALACDLHGEQRIVSDLDAV